MRGLILSCLYDFAKNRYISLASNTFSKRSVISSHAAFDIVQIRTLCLVVRTICSIAATSVRVFPVPEPKKKIDT